MTSPEPLEMKIGLTVIEDLGINLYGKLPPVLSEIVANAWDADASTVKIAFPTDGNINASQIIITDNGYGISYRNIQNKYLIIGRKRRQVESTDKSPNGRIIMGRKGIGKLSVFGVAKTVEIETINNSRRTIFKMNLDDILTSAKSGNIYKPKVIKYDSIIDGKSGTIVRLSNLKRKTAINVESVRKDMAKHFSIISSGFGVLVNDNQITKLDKIQKEDMQYKWDINDECIMNENPHWTVSGWIGSSKTPLDESDRGIILLARGKLIQTPTTFNTKIGEKMSYAYITGELNVEFMDDGEDLISTNRQSLAWETEQGIALQDWGIKKIKKISLEWAERRRDDRMKEIMKEPNMKTWFKNLNEPERRIAKKMIDLITSSERLDGEKRKTLAEYVMRSFNQAVFRTMVENLEDDPDQASVLELFQEWNVIEAREILELAQGRLATIKQFVKHVDNNEKEVPVIHNFLKEWPWILEPTWTNWKSEVNYSKILAKNYPDVKLDEPDKRIDFLCMGVGDTLNVVELKRPKHKINSKDLDQLMDYVLFVNEKLGTGHTHRYNTVSGYIIAGDISGDRLTQAKIKEGEKNRRYVRKYHDLIGIAENLYQDFKEKLDKIDQ